MVGSALIAGYIAGLGAVVGLAAALVSVCPVAVVIAGPLAYLAMSPLGSFLAYLWRFK